MAKTNLRRQSIALAFAYFQDFLQELFIRLCIFLLYAVCQYTIQHRTVPIISFLVFRTSLTAQGGRGGQRVEVGQLCVHISHVR